MMRKWTFGPTVSVALQSAEIQLRPTDVNRFPNGRYCESPASALGRSATVEVFAGYMPRYMSALRRSKSLMIFPRCAVHRREKIYRSEYTGCQHAAMSRQLRMCPLAVIVGLSCQLVIQRT